MTTVTQPIDLIVANTMHKAVQAIKEAEMIKSVLGNSAACDFSGINEVIARKLLCSISHDASISVVLKALQSAGAPDSLDLIGEGIQAVKDRQDGSAR